MPGPVRRHYWCLIVLVLGMGVLLVTQCVASTVPRPLAPHSAVLCEHRCPTVSPQHATPVVLSTLGLLLPWPQQHLGAVNEGDCGTVSLVLRGASGTRSPPCTIAYRAASS